MLRLGLAAVAAALAAAPAVAQKPAGGSTTAQFQQAFAVAQKASNGGHLVLARSENKAGLGVVFGFYFLRDGVIWEYEIHGRKVVKAAATGGGSGDSDEVSEDVIVLIEERKKAKAKIPDGRLMEIAGEHLKDAAYSELKFEKQGDALVLRVGDDLVLDATTGKVVKGKK